MSRNYKICPVCSTNFLKSSDAKQCVNCYQTSRNKSYCQTCNKKLLHSDNHYCMECFADKRRTGRNLAICKVCGGELSIYKNSNQYNTGICQNCYRGSLTKRWNPNLTDKERSETRTKQPAYYQWRKEVFDRGAYTCQCCRDSNGGNLVSHHIENFSKNIPKRFDVNNGITLCENCHISFHKSFGWKNNDLIQLMDFIKESNGANWIIIGNN